MRSPVILGCGKRKVDAVDVPAWRLYCGSQFTMSLAWADSVTSRDRLFILSAKYGLIRCTEIVSPYDVRIGAQGSIDLVRVAAQARELGLETELPVFYGPSDYAVMLRRAVPGLVWLNQRMDTPGRGIGYQRQWLKRNHGVIPLAAPRCAGKAGAA